MGWKKLVAAENYRKQKSSLQGGNKMEENHKYKISILSTFNFWVFKKSLFKTWSNHRTPSFLYKVKEKNLQLLYCKEIIIKLIISLLRVYGDLIRKVDRLICMRYTRPLFIFQLPARLLTARLLNTLPIREKNPIRHRHETILAT